MQKDYAGLCPVCHRLIGACVFDAGPKECAKFAAEFIKDGYDLVRMTTEEIRAGPWMHAEDCAFPAAVKQRKRNAREKLKGAAQSELPGIAPEAPPRQVTDRTLGNLGDSPFPDLRRKLMPHFRKKPVVIRAVQLCWKNWNEVCELLGGIVSPENPGRPAAASEVSDACGEPGPTYIALPIPTPEGVMTALHGDWIVRGIKGEIYPCKPDIFAATYEAIV